MEHSITNGRLALTLRDGDEAVISVPESQPIVISCLRANGEWVTLDLIVPGMVEIEGHGRGTQRSVVMRPNESISIHPPYEGDTIEIFCRDVDPEKGKARFAIDAPRDYRISRTMREDAVHRHLSA